MFERLSRLIIDFEAYLIDLARCILPLLRASYPEVVVKLVEIAEFEDREDEKVRLHAAFHHYQPALTPWQAITIRLVKKSANMDAASKLKSMQANARVIEHYRSGITETISDTVLAALNASYEWHQRDPGAFLGDLG